MNSKIGIFMKVFRNEAGIHAAVESVLAQTYTNWTFFVMVNNATKEVLQKYAENEKRMVLLDGKPGDSFVYCSKTLATDEFDYWLTLDADDCLSAECAEKLLDFAEKNHCDVTAGAFEFVNPDGTVIEKRGYPDQLVFPCEKINNVLPVIYGQLRTIWGKLYKAEVIRSFSEERIPQNEEFGGYGGDTLFVFNLLYEAKTIGVIPDMIYRYTLSLTGGTHVLAEGRLNSDELLFRFVKSFLEEKSVYDDVCAHYLYAVYGNAIADTVSLLYEAKISKEERNNGVHQVLANPLTKLLLLRDAEGLTTSKKDYFFFKLLYMFFVVNDDRISYEEYTMIGNSRCQLLDKEEYELLVKFPGAVFEYHTDHKPIFQKNILRIYLKLENPMRKTLLSIIRKKNNNVILASVLKENFIQNNSDILFEIIDENYSALVEKVRERVLSGTEQEYLEILLNLWTNLAAITEDSNEYVFSQEVMIEFLIRQKRKEEASKMLQELISMGINDDNVGQLVSLMESADNN